MPNIIMMRHISSVQNQEIKEIVQLGDAKERRRQQRFIVEGLRAIATFVEAGHRPLHVYVTENKLAEAQKLVDDSLITLITQPVLKRISNATTPSGIVALFSIPTESPGITTGLVLARISDPGNMGTLIRTTVALGMKTIVVVEGVDVWSPKVVQASAGTLAQVNVISCSWEKLLKLKGTLTLTGLVVQGGKKPWESKLTETLLVVGSEARGIPHEWLADCDELLTLPMPGGTESLNAAIAGSIVLYLAWQQKNY